MTARKRGSGVCRTPRTEADGSMTRYVIPLLLGLVFASSPAPADPTYHYVIGGAGKHGDCIQEWTFMFRSGPPALSRRYFKGNSRSLCDGVASSPQCFGPTQAQPKQLYKRQYCQDGD